MAPKNPEEAKNDTHKSEIDSKKGTLKMAHLRSPTYGSSPPPRPFDRLSYHCRFVHFTFVGSFLQDIQCSEHYSASDRKKLEMCAIRTYNFPC